MCKSDWAFLVRQRRLVYSWSRRLFVHSVSDNSYHPLHIDNVPIYSEPLRNFLRISIRQYEVTNPQPSENYRRCKAPPPMRRCTTPVRCRAIMNWPKDTYLLGIPVSPSVHTPMPAQLHVRTSICQLARPHAMLHGKRPDVGSWRCAGRTTSLSCRRTFFSFHLFYGARAHAQNIAPARTRHTCTHARARQGHAGVLACLYSVAHVDAQPAACDQAIGTICGHRPSVVTELARHAYRHTSVL